MLPANFKWAPRWQYDTGHNAVYCGSKIVAYMDRRLDGSWFARMDGRTRDCTSRESGRAGCEAWVTRHEARLLVEAREYEANLPMRPWMPTGQKRDSAGNNCPFSPTLGNT